MEAQHLPLWSFTRKGLGTDLQERVHGSESQVETGTSLLPGYKPLNPFEGQGLGPTHLLSISCNQLSQFLTQSE